MDIFAGKRTLVLIVSSVELTVHDEHDSFADRRRHSVARDAQICTHV